MEPGSNPQPNPFDPNQFKPAQDRVKRSHWTAIILLLVLLVFGGGWLIVRKTKQAIGWFHNKNGQVMVGDYGEKRYNATYIEPFDASIKTAKFTLNGGASIYKLGDTTSQLFHADAVLFHSRYTLNGSANGSDYNMDLSMQSRSKTNFNKLSDSIDLKLNTAPIWDIRVNTGATELDFDLTKYKISNLKIAGSAGSFTVKMGQPLEQTNISVVSGAADVTINIPKSAACHIEKHSAFSSTTFPGFVEKEDGSFETAGYASAKNKMVIKFTGGISDLKVNRY